MARKEIQAVKAAIMIVELRAYDWYVFVTKGTDELKGNSRLEALLNVPSIGV